jgi:hypothetical protein
MCLGFFAQGEGKKSKTETNCGRTAGPSSVSHAVKPATWIEGRGEGKRTLFISAVIEIGCFVGFGHQPTASLGPVIGGDAGNAILAVNDAGCPHNVGRVLAHRI